jgi:hypothetical protein
VDARLQPGPGRSVGRIDKQGYRRHTLLLSVVLDGVDQRLGVEATTRVRPDERGDENPGDFPAR